MPVTIQFLQPNSGEITGVDGRVSKAIPVLSWRHSFSHPISTVKGHERGTTEQAEHGDFSFTKSVDSFSVELNRLCWNGRTVGSVVLSVYRTDDDKTPYLQVNLDKVIVSGVAIDGTGGEVTETVRLLYGKVTYSTSLGQQGEVNSGAHHDLLKQEVANLR